jgi:hypothetical protein
VSLCVGWLRAALPVDVGVVGTQQGLIADRLAAAEDNECPTADTSEADRAWPSVSGHAQEEGPSRQLNKGRRSPPWYEHAPLTPPECEYVPSTHCSA